MADQDSRSGTRYSTPELLRWLEGVHARHDEALALAFSAPERRGLPALQVGPAEGRLLHLLVRLVAARRIVEIGTLAGYSAIHLARALPPDGHLWTLEREPGHVVVARECLAAAGLSARVTVVEGDAVQTLSGLEPHGPFDAVFLDADKGRYDHYGRWAAAHTRPGGLLLADNAYFFGRLLDDAPDAAAMRRFHEEAAARYDTACVPTPDGLLVGLLR